MSTLSSPSKLAKKQSLSILSSSTLNQLNNNNQNTQHAIKPAKERIISESTGLIKFSLKKPDPENVENIQLNNVDLTRQEVENNNAEVKVDNNDIENFNKLPIHIPINKTDNMKTNAEKNTENLLFEMASKQRKILDLTEQLKQAKEELSILEKQYQDLTYAESPELKDYSISSVPSSPSVVSTLRKSTSIMNLTINPPKINTEQFTKTQKQVTNTINQFTNNTNAFISKSKTFFESNLNKNIQISNGFLNSIFVKETSAGEFSDNDDDTVSLDNVTQGFDFSVDFDLDRLNKLDMNKKINDGRILADLKKVIEDPEDNRLNRILSSLSESSEEDYGGDAESFH